MAIIISGYIDCDKITKARLKDGKRLFINITVNDETDERGYGQDVSIKEGMTKDERESGMKEIYLGNGKTVWVNGVTPLLAAMKPKKGEQPSQTPLLPTPTESSPTDDLPF